MLNAADMLRVAEACDVFTIKRLIGTIPKVKPAEKKMLCVVYGFASGVKASHDERGIKVKVFGDFLGYAISKSSPEKGDSLRSKVASFPPAISDILVSAQIGDGRCTEFGFRIGIMGDDSVVGYHYVVERFIGLDAYAPLDRLIERTMAQQSE